LYFILFYEVIEDYLNEREAFRSVHLQLAQEAKERGELILAGALSEPTDGAILIFSGTDSSVAEDFAKKDPYVKNGLVTRWYVRKWNAVIS